MINARLHMKVDSILLSHVHMYLLSVQQISILVGEVAVFEYISALSVCWSQWVGLGEGAVSVALEGSRSVGPEAG